MGSFDNTTSPHLELNSTEQGSDEPSSVPTRSPAPSRSSRARMPLPLGLCACTSPPPRCRRRPMRETRVLRVMVLHTSSSSESAVHSSKYFELVRWPRAVTHPYLRPLHSCRDAFWRSCCRSRREAHTCIVLLAPLSRPATWTQLSVRSPSGGRWRAARSATQPPVDRRRSRDAELRRASGSRRAPLLKHRESRCPPSRRRAEPVPRS